MDELPADAGDQRAKYHSDVGYLPCASHHPSFLAQWLKTRIYTGRGHRRVLAVPPVRLLGFPGPMEQEAASDGLSGAPSTRRVSPRQVSLTDLLAQGIIMFLQSLPTQDWTDHEIEMLLSEAFVHYSTWHNAQSHFGGK